MKRMKKLIAIFTCICLVAVFATACGSEANTATTGSSSGENEAQATDNGEKYLLRVGAATAGTHPHNVWMEAFKTELEEKSSGRIEVQLLPSGQYGNLIELIQGLRDGTVNSAVFPTTYFANTHMGATVIDIPGLFADSKQAYEVLSKNDTLYTQSFEDNGIIPVCYLRLYEREILSRKEITSMTDIGTMKLWSLPSPIIQKEVEIMGATISNIDMGEVATSLQNGAIDGVLTDKALFMSQKLYDSAKYLLDAPNDAMVSLFAISPTWWKQLPEDLQEIVKTTAKDISETVANPYIDEMTTNITAAMEDAGVTILTPDAELQKEFDNAAVELKEWYLETYPEYKEIYNELVDLASK